MASSVPSIMNLFDFLIMILFSLPFLPLFLTGCNMVPNNQPSRGNSSSRGARKSTPEKNRLGGNSNITLAPKERGQASNSKSRITHQDQEIKLLLEDIKKDNSEGVEALLNKYKDDEDNLKELLKSKDDGNRNILSRAAYYGSTKTVDYLLEKYSKECDTLNENEPINSYPIHWAFRVPRSEEEILNMLEQFAKRYREGDVRRKMLRKNGKGETILSWAEASKKMKISDYLKNL